MKNSSWYECKIWLIEKKTELGSLRHHTSSEITSKLFPVAKETWLWQNKRKILLLLTKDTIRVTIMVERFLFYQKKPKTVYEKTKMFAALTETLLW